MAIATSEQTGSAKHNAIELAGFVGMTMTRRTDLKR